MSHELVAGYHPIWIMQRQKLIETISVTDNSGNWDFTGKSFEMQIRKTKKSFVVVNCAPLITVNSPPTSFTLEIPRSITETLVPGEYVYDLWIEERPLLSGPFTVLASVTRD